MKLKDRTVSYSDNTHVDETTVVDDSNVCALESQELYVSDKETGDELQEEAQTPQGQF